jgi:hypothetical protein
MALIMNLCPVIPAKPEKPLAGPDYSEHLGKPKTVMAKPVVGLVTVEKKKKGEVTDQVPTETVVEHPGLMFGNNPLMEIVVEGGRTMNLGNYESAKVGITIKVPCDPDQLQQAYEFATDWISKKLEEALKDAKGE